jgi:hypothetical protein
VADRSAAELFANVFELLANDDWQDRRALALKFWDMMHNYDFSPYQMYCDKALLELGLARKEIDPASPEDGPVWMYGPRER